MLRRCVLSLILLLLFRLVNGQSSRQMFERNETSDTHKSLITWLNTTDTVMSLVNVTVNGTYLQPSTKKGKSDEIDQTTISIREQDRIQNQGKADLLKQLEFLGFGCFYPFMVVLGITTNVLTLVLLWKSAFSSTPSVYMAALAVSDILYLICRLAPTLRYYSSSNVSLLLTTIYAYYFVYVGPVKHIVYTAGIWILMTFTIERFSAVYFPLKAKVFFSKTKAKVTVVTIYGLMIIANATEFWKRRVKIQLIYSRNKPMWRSFSVTEFGADVKYQTARTVIYLVICLLPIAVLTVLNIMIVVKLHKAGKRRRNKLTVQNGSTKSREQQVTRLLVWLVCVFILCNVMEILSGLLPMKIGRNTANNGTLFDLEFAFLFARIIVICNPFFNFILYVCCNEFLRNSLLQIAACRAFNVDSETQMPT